MKAYGATPPRAVTLEDRIASLESDFEEVKKLKGIPGSRGPAGSIEAAVDQAMKSVSDAEARVRVAATESFKRFTDEISKLRQEFADQRKHL
jgi:hypothetical protein